MAFLNDTTSRPNEIFVLDATTGRARQLTHVNDGFMATLEEMQSWLSRHVGGQPTLACPEFSASPSGAS